MNLPLSALEEIATHSPIVNEWLKTIEELRKGNVKPILSLPSYEWQTLRMRIPEVDELLNKYAPTQP